MRKNMLTEKQSKFAREVGSVVLGVLIALGIGEIADAARWKLRVQSSMEAMRSELGGNRFNVVERRAYQACLDKRLTDIGQVLAEARRTGVLPNIAEVGRPGLRLTEGAAFEVATSEGVSLHMDRHEAREIAAVYGLFDAYRTLALEEHGSWRTLQLMNGAPGPISDNLLTSLLLAWGEATEQSKWMGLLAQQQDDKLGTLGFATEYEAAEPDRIALTKRVRTSKICAPMLVNGKALNGSSVA